MLTAANTTDCPRAPDLRLAPELAAIHMLDTALAVTSEALRACSQQTSMPSTRQTLAAALLPLLAVLAKLTFEYRLAYIEELAAEAGPTNEIPC